MKRRANATLIGAFVVAGLALLLAAVIAAGGGQLFARKERVVMYFGGSIYGLQVGAPVVFRGVRMGSVSSIGLVYDKASDSFSIPVRADLEPEAIRGLAGANGHDQRGALSALLARGLRAQLSMQSLLTGQLYVDLDLRPSKPPALRGHDDLALEIPTVAAPIQDLKNQLDGLDLRRLLDDVSAIAGSARALVAGPQLRATLDNLSALTGSLRAMSARLDKRVDPLADAATTTLRDAALAAQRLARAADGIGDTATRLGGTAERFNTLLAPDSPLLGSIERSAEEFGRLATSLRAQTAEDSALVQRFDHALDDVSRAARAMRELAELLERHPDALLRGRRPAAPTTTTAESPR
ncbi:MlaD family protein [Roseateles violae]|uniref:MlaD family protein n=1 Tax=Roseateles violae TaxID=3058042 RepID=A0ABT8DQN0_9BURK|nr:MlaD family protein [Pelomonas sp. PFR6]MDN3920645.1 MlaD family protein [Pelomonas sp. PFR6]